MPEIRGYVDAAGSGPFARWFERLNSIAAARVATALVRMESGNFSDSKAVGAGVSEYRIDFGPGYRINYGNDGNTCGCE